MKIRQFQVFYFIFLSGYYHPCRFFLLQSLSKSLSPHIYTDDEKRHFRTLSIINDEGKHVLRLVLEKLLIGTTLDERLANPDVKKQMNDALRFNKIRKDQYDILYPSSGLVQIENADVTLLVFLIRQLHPFMKVGNKIWTDPPRGDLSPEADVTRLKEMRNKLVHCGKTTLTNDEFEIYFQELEMILCRLVRYVCSTAITIDDIVKKLDHKKQGLFEKKPVTSDVATSVSSSLDSDVTSESDKASIYSMCTLPDIDKLCPARLEDVKKEVMTSTTSLQQKRKLSSKVKSCLGPFVNTSKKENDKENEHLPKRIKTKDKQKVSRQKSRSCSCSFRSSFRNSESSVTKTNDHSLQKYRCNISGLITLASGIVVAVDSSHSVVQALATSGDVIDEFECDKPNSIATIDSCKFAVTLKQSAKVKILKFNKENSCIESVQEFDIGCDHWLCDVKYSKGYLYILCENGDLHLLNANTGTDAGLIQTKLGSASHFDVSNNGERLFVSHGYQISCLDKYGSKIWCISNKSKMTYKGLVLHKDNLFVCAWDKDKVVSMATKNGKCLKEYSDEQLRCPWSLCMHKGKLFISQFMSNLNEESCREIVVLKL